jgi:hypothetical protein
VGPAVAGLLVTLLAPLALARTTEAASLPSDLRDTGLYADWDSKQVAADNLPFVPQYPLWSDGATKHRWIHLPPGTAIDARKPDAWVFPVGTRLWKEFSVGGRVETRHMVRTRAGWLYGSYVWTPDGQRAVLAPAEGVDSVRELPDGRHYSIPSRADCLACHEGRPTPVLGFSALQLSTDRDPLAVHGERAAPEAMDLHQLVARRLIRGLPGAWIAAPPRVAGRTPVERAALGYLHGNCGQCHNPTGPLASLALDLWHDPSAADEPGISSTFSRPSRFRFPGESAQAARILPGAPEQSTVLARMRSRHAAVQMPPLGTQLVDDEAVRLVERWIQERPAVPTRSRP